jgi:anti-anti-sigma factor
MHTTQDSPVGSIGPTVFPPPLLTITSAKEGYAYVICVEGELDLSECPCLERALRKAEASHAIRILLDLEQLAFIDAAGLSVLVMAWLSLNEQWRSTAGVVGQGQCGAPVPSDRPRHGVAIYPRLTMLRPEFLAS